MGSMVSDSAAEHIAHKCEHPVAGQVILSLDVMAPSTCDHGRMWRLPLSSARRTDVGFALGFFAAGLVLTATGFNRLGDADQSWWTLIPLAAAACLQTVRSTHPAAAFAGGTAILLADIAFVGSIGTWLVYSDLVYAACVYGTVRLTRALYVTVAVISAGSLVVVAAVWAAQEWRIVFLALVWLAAFILSPLFYGLAVRGHRDSLVAERAHARVRAELAAREQSEAVTQERQRLARELHDVIAGRLSSIAMFSSTALGHRDNAELTGRALQAVRSSSVEALTEMRTMIDLLSDGSASHTTASLRRLDRLVEPLTTAGTPVTLHRDGDWGDAAPPIAPVIDIAAYRILAESLANAANHAPGQPITASLSITDDQLRIEVVNPIVDDPRENVIPGGGRGVANMTTRAAAVGGTLHTRHSPREFTVLAVLPTHPPRTEEVDA